MTKMMTILEISVDDIRTFKQNVHEKNEI